MFDNIKPPMDTQACEIRRLTVPEQVDSQIKQATERLEDLKRLKDLFEKNPALSETMEIMSRIGIGRY